MINLYILFYSICSCFSAQICLAKKHVSCRRKKQMARDLQLEVRISKPREIPENAETSPKTRQRLNITNPSQVPNNCQLHPIAKNPPPPLPQKMKKLHSLFERLRKGYYFNLSSNFLVRHAPHIPKNIKTKPFAQPAPFSRPPRFAGAVALRGGLHCSPASAESSSRRGAEEDL